MRSHEIDCGDSLHSHLFQHRLDHWPEHKVKKNDAQLLKDNSLVTDEMFVKLEHFGICLHTTSSGGKSEERLVLNKAIVTYQLIQVQNTHVKPSTRRLARFLALERAT